jgi:hypothetical protein
MWPLNACFGLTPAGFNTSYVLCKRSKTALLNIRIWIFLENGVREGSGNGVDAVQLLERHGEDRKAGVVGDQIRSRIYIRKDAGPSNE